MNIVGPKVQELREQQQLAPEMLSARCNFLGWDISRGYLEKIEAKVRRVTDIEVELLAKALCVPVNFLFD